MTDIVDFAVEQGPVAGVVVIRPKQVTDGRGTIRELFRRSDLDAAGVTFGDVRQINVTDSHLGVVRGMHAEAMTKLVAVANGRAFGAYVDLRRDSPTFAEVMTVVLEPGVQVLVPAGVANGFQAVTDGCRYIYCFDAEWSAGMSGEACSPFGLGFDWPVPVDPTDERLVSAKDSAAPQLGDIVNDRRGSS